MFHGRTVTTDFFLILVFLCILTGPAPAQTPDPSDYSEPRYSEIVEERGVMVAMRDGVQLSVDLYLPMGAGKVPAILSSTPYDNSSTGNRERARWFAHRGYAVVLADVRGRYDSEGVWDPFGVKHKTDGYDLVEWVGDRPWSTGRIGMIGGSYLGWTQWWAASQAPPSLKAIAPQVVPAEAFRNFPYQEGVLVAAPLDWAAMMSGRTRQTLRTEGAYAGWTATRFRDFLHTPYVELDEARGIRASPWFGEWIRQNRSIDPYWSDIAYQNPEGWGEIRVPSLNMTGWFDAAFPGTVYNYTGMKEHGATPEARRPFLLIGPWPHGLNRSTTVGNFDYGSEAVIDLDGYIIRWFDHWLKGVENGIDKEPPVRIFVMGENRWRAEEAWPLPQTVWTKYYLSSGGHANSLKGDGILTTKVPEEGGYDTYVYDPDRPTRSPYTGGHTQDGAVDTRLSALGDEVLVYDTPPLEESVEVVGPIEMKLYASTSAHDTDWMVRLVDVHPDGYAALLAEGLMRARNRDPNNGGRYNAAQLSRIDPGKVYEYTIEFWRPTGNLFKEGHRIRLEISSSYYPYYLRNMNTGHDNVGLARESDAVVATQEVHHGGNWASYISLPVISRDQ